MSNECANTHYLEEENATLTTKVAELLEQKAGLVGEVASLGRRVEELGKENAGLQWYMDTDPCRKALEAISEGWFVNSDDAQGMVEIIEEAKQLATTALATSTSPDTGDTTLKEFSYHGVNGKVTFKNCIAQCRACGEVVEVEFAYSTPKEGDTMSEREVEDEREVGEVYFEPSSDDDLLVIVGFIKREFPDLYHRYMDVTPKRDLIIWVLQDIRDNGHNQSGTAMEVSDEKVD